MSNELSPEQIKHILQGIAIPPQPQVMVDLQMEQCSPNCTVESIASLISQDVGLSGAILKTVNSPYFKLANKIGSITQAVGLLGINSVVNLVNAQSIKGALSDEEIIAMGAFWDTAMEVAMTAAAIAKEIGYNSPDEAYTLGLFHNCGIPLLSRKFSNYPAIIQETYHRADACITDTENSLINTNHAVVGYYVSKSWNLPPYICAAIHEHHHVTQKFLDDSTSSQLKTLLAILKMSEHISGLYKTLGGCREDYEWEQVKKAILIYIGLSDYDYEGLIDHIRALGLGS
jgi:HD-like signal output (HDOD) protein